MTSHQDTIGILQPSDLDLVQRAFDRVCLEKRLAPGSHDASDAAFRVLYFYERGMIDEDSLFLAATGRMTAARAA